MTKWEQEELPLIEANIEADPEEVGKVEAVILLLDAMICPLSQQRVFDVSKYVNCYDDGAAD